MRRLAVETLVRWARDWYLVIPGALTAALAFRAGGFFPDATGAAAAALALLLVGWFTLARAPYAGWSPLLVVAAASLTAFCAWTLLSSTWSDAAGRALVEFDRALLYLLVLVLVGGAATRSGALGATLRWTFGAIAVVGVVALTSRLLPEAVPSSPTLLNERLSFPLTYWNALGILMAVGTVLAVHLSASTAERPVVRVAAGLLIPALAVTLYFTFARGPIAVAAVGTVAYAMLARSRALVSVLLTVGPLTALALRQAYGADLLARENYTSEAAVAQGHRVALSVGACMIAAGVLRALALALDDRLERLRLPARLRTPVIAGAIAVAVLAGAGAAVAADLPRRLGDARESFVGGDVLRETGDLRDRLGQAGNNGRIVHWRVAWDAFEGAPVLGTGAGTFRLAWERDRPPPAFQINDAHSLYLEVLAELGVPGLALLLLAIGTLLWAGAAGLRGPDRPAHAAFLAAAAALLLHAGVDWDWEMPAVMVWLFGAGAVAAASSRGSRLGEPGRLTRVCTGVGCLVVALTPALVVVSQSSLDRAGQAFARGDCASAVDAALDSLERLRLRPEPFEVLGYCNLRAGASDLAVQAMGSAQRRDPGNWRYAYGLAVARALAGQDPRPDAARARGLNPLEPLARELDDAVGGTESRARWRRIAARARIPTE